MTTQQESDPPSELPKPKIAILAGDSVFSYLMASKLIRALDIESVVLSNYSTGSFKKLSSIFKKTSRSYFLYRGFVQILSRLLSRHSIRDLAMRKGIPITTISGKKDFARFDGERFDLSIAFNFDVIIPSDYISSNKHGVLNVHAGNLPRDKGISPVVWAFCRGDNDIWISFYLMDGGIDTGVVLEKKNLKIDQSWSLFRTYCEVLLLSSGTILCLVKNITAIGNPRQRPQDSVPPIAESYNSWPDEQLAQSMTKAKRSYIQLRDLVYLMKILKSQDR